MDLAAITSQNAGVVTIVTDGAVTASVPVPGKPAAVAVDPVRGIIHVVAVETKLLHRIAPDGREIARIPLPGAPFGVAVDPTNGHSLVSDWEGSGIVEVGDAVLREIATGAAPSGIAVADGLIVTADRDADQLTLIGDQTRHVAVGHHPFGVTIHDGHAFAANVLSETVSVVDLDSATLVATIPVGERPYAIAFAAGRGFVTNQYEESVTVFDAASWQVIGTIEVGEYPEGIAPYGDRLLVANWFSDTLSVIDPMTMKVIETLDMPAGPRAFGSFTATLP